MDDKEFVSNFRMRILIEILLRIENARHQCRCGEIIFPGFNEYHFFTCKDPGGPCADRTFRHNEIRDELLLLFKRFSHKIELDRPLEKQQQKRSSPRQT